MSEFKVGDKVVCVDSCGSSGRLTKGETYTIAAYDSDEEGEWVAVLEDPSYVDDPEPGWIPQRFEPAPVAMSPELESQIEQSTFGVGDRVVDEAGYAGTIARLDREYGFVDVLFDRFAEDKFNTIRMPKSKLRAEKKGTEKQCVTKDTNPKDAVGIKKVPMSVLPANVLAEAALGLMEGARKYRRHNYRVVGVRASVYYDATMRHLMDWWEGTDIDPDSGLHHVSKAISSLIVLRDAMLQEKCNDDRPPKTLNREWVKDANRKAEAIIEKYPEELPPYTEI